MTEQEWLDCADLLLASLEGKVSDRKLRLFAVACCRSVEDCLWTKSSQDAVLVAERYADQIASEADLANVQSLVMGGLELYPGEPVYDASCWACGRDAEDLWRCANYAINSSTRRLDWGGVDGEVQCLEVANKERSIQARLLHEIIGNPLRSIAMNQNWLIWNDRTVVKTAQGIYEERAFDRMPILADALTDAGCDNEEILNHCRSAESHARGCWVVDLILGKK
jgi:hypothetical protein